MTFSFTGACNAFDRTPNNEVYPLQSAPFFLPSWVIIAKPLTGGNFSQRFKHFPLNGVVENMKNGMTFEAT